MENKTKLWILGIVVLAVLSLGLTAIFPINSPVRPLAYADISGEDSAILHGVLNNDSPRLKAVIKGSIYEINETLTTLGVCSDVFGVPVPSNATIIIYGPDNATLVVENLTETKTGMYWYSITTNFTVGTHFLEFTCFSGSDSVRTYGEFQLPNWVERIKSNFNTLTSLGSEEYFVVELETQNSIFPNDEIRFEALFYDSEGATIKNMTSINLTVFDPNENVYLSVDQSSFTPSNLGVYEFDYSVGSSPTTGQYRAHVEALFNGVLATDVHQFRITSGAIFRYTVETPNAVCLKETSTPLKVENIITNEGDTSTETSCLNWVDLNDNNVKDSGEPEASFSKEVIPGQTLVFESRINTHDLREGVYFLRGECDYVGSTQPNAIASTTFLVERCGLPGITGLAISEPIVRDSDRVFLFQNVKDSPFLCLLLFFIGLLIGVLWRYGFFKQSFNFCLSFGWLGFLIYTLLFILAFYGIYVLILRIFGG